MISSTSSDRAARLPAATDLAPRGRAHHHVASTGDNVSTTSADTLASALASQPEVRPAEVQRARALASDSTYPPMPVLQKVASTILSAPDLSEDHS